MAEWRAGCSRCSRFSARGSWFCPLAPWRSSWCRSTARWWSGSAGASSFAGDITVPVSPATRPCPRSAWSWSASRPSPFTSAACRLRPSERESTASLPFHPPLRHLRRLLRIRLPLLRPRGPGALRLPPLLPTGLESMAWTVTPRAVNSNSTAVAAPSSR